MRENSDTIITGFLPPITINEKSNNNSRILNENREGCLANVGFAAIKVNALGAMPEKLELVMDVLENRWQNEIVQDRDKSFRDLGRLPITQQ